ncbi:FMN-dependent NADH-azoreductase [Asticcacaulis tiandongensis]|uniref:FMN-dependent NADH-azoreductase n=1 Tax=Asticcacaulis tiandongensis TaxID=2565365 RepID=UPI0011292B50|nr:NAD(P)H-dependent oxidoreductase [Asticcacaulis tiandongensis]
MSNTLIIHSTVKSEGSVSRVLTESYKSDLKKADPSVTFTEYDLGLNPLPALSASNISGFFGTAEPESEGAALAAKREELITALEAADKIIIGAPMYNFGMSALLKTWFDYVLKSGRTFRYSEAGPEGLVTGKSAIVIETRDGFYSEGDGTAVDFQEGHIRTLLGFMGVTDVTFVRAEKMAFGPEAKTAAIEGAANDLSALAAA